MFIRVGINGFGRIGRVVLRACLQNPDLQVAVINDPALDVEYICYLIKFDSTHGKLEGSVEYNKNEIIINDNIVIRVYNEKSPPEIPWHLSGVNYVIEASGMFTTMEKAMGHLINDCVKQVIVTAPSIDIPMIVLGVNEDKLTADQRIISAGSSTLYCLAPIIKILEDKFGVLEGFVTSIHAMTPSMKPLDGLCLRGKHWRDHRSAVQNIIPAATGACKALGKIIPKAKDKLTGLAFRVPIVNVSVLDLTVKLVTPTSLEHIAKEVEEASRTSMKNIVKVSNDEVVSSDFMKDSHSCILDLDASLQLRPTSFKLVCWYENEYSYASRVIDYIIFNEVKQHLDTKSMKESSSSCSKIKKSNSKSSLCQYFKGDAKENVAVLAAKMSIRGIPNLCGPHKIIRPRQPALVKDIPNVDNTFKSMICKKPTSNDAQKTKQNQSPRFLKKTKSLSGAWNKKKEFLDTLDGNKSKKHKHFYDFGSRYTDNLDSVRPHQEHLEKIKENFNKVANITEALLKKSCSGKFQSTSKSLDSNFKSLIPRIGTLGKQSPKDDCKSIKEENSSYYLSENSDKKLSDLVDKAMKKKGDNDVPVITEEESQIICVTNFDSIEPVEITSSTKLEIDEVKLEINCSKYDNDNILQISENKNYCMESVSSGSSKDLYEIPKKVETLNTSSNKYEEDNNSIINNNNEIIHNQTVSFTVRTSPGQNFLEEKRNDINSSPKCLNLLPENNSLVVESVQYSNYNGDTCPFLDLKHKDDDYGGTNEDKNANGNTKINVDAVANDSMEFSNEMNDQIKMNANNTSLLVPLADDVILKAKSIIFESLENNDPSKRSSVQLTPVSSKADAGEGKSDIYDKLDSRSASEASENSFRIEKKKSQVLDITDVSKSLEDLHRLDKICRIIEISDDLSDRLFANLNNDDTDSNPLAGRVWSFNDMCKKIKFDEFCEKLFRNDSS